MINYEYMCYLNKWHQLGHAMHDAAESMNELNDGFTSLTEVFKKMNAYEDLYCE